MKASYEDVLYDFILKWALRDATLDGRGNFKGVRGNRVVFSTKDSLDAATAELTRAGWKFSRKRDDQNKPYMLFVDAANITKYFTLNSANALPARRRPTLKISALVPAIWAIVTASLLIPAWRLSSEDDKYDLKRSVAAVALSTLSTIVGAGLVAVLTPLAYRVAFKNHGLVEGVLVFYEFFLLAVVALTVCSVAVVAKWLATFVR